LGGFFQSLASRPRLRRGFAAIWPLAFYLALSLLFFASQPDWKTHYYGYSTDPMAFVWFLNWWPFAIAHGLNPFVTHYVWYPTGFNLTWATSVPLLALLATPLTLWQGPVFSYNVLTLAAPAFAAWAAYLLAKDLTKNTQAALVGGYVFGFSSYELDSMMTAMNLDTIFLVPLAVWFCMSHLHKRLSNKTFFGAFSLLLLAQLGISTEVLASSGLLGGLTWMIFFGFAPPSGRLALLRLAGAICCSIALMIIIAAPFFYYLIIGLPELPKFINSPFLGSADSFGFIVPNLPVSTASEAFHNFADEFRGYAPYKNAYLGLPLLTVMAWYFAAMRHHRYVQALALTTLLIAVFSLGPVLHYNGNITHIWMPWAIVTHVPIIRSILPGRLVMFLSLCAALVLALWLASARPGWQTYLRFGVAGIVGLFLLPNRPHTLPPPWRVSNFFVPQRHFLWSPWPVSAFFTPRHVLQALGPAKNIILLPVPAFGPGMAWQVNAGLTFSQSGGYLGLTPLTEQAWPVLIPMVFGPPEALFRQDFMSYCYAHHVDDILIGPNPAPSIADAIHSLNWPSHVDDGIEIIRVLPAAETHYRLVEGDYWPSPGRPGWMGRQVTIVTFNMPGTVTLSAKLNPVKQLITIAATHGSTHQTVTVNQLKDAAVSLPATGTTVLATDDVFVPAVVLHYQDQRQLSVTLEFAPDH
jgi:hypothetical protein